VSKPSVLVKRLMLFMMWMAGVSAIVAAVVSSVVLQAASIMSVMTAFLPRFVAVVATILPLVASVLRLPSLITPICAFNIRARVSKMLRVGHSSFFVCVLLCCTVLRS